MGFGSIVQCCKKATTHELIGSNGNSSCLWSERNQGERSPRFRRTHRFGAQRLIADIVSSFSEAEGLAPTSKGLKMPRLTGANVEPIGGAECSRQAHMLYRLWMRICCASVTGSRSMTCHSTTYRYDCAKIGRAHV